MNRNGPGAVAPDMTPDTTAEQHSRRSVLTAGAAVAGAAVGTVALAACGGGSGGGGSSAPTTAPAAGGEVLALSEVPVGQAKAAKTPDGQDVFVAQPTAGTVACFSAICTHQGCTVNPPENGVAHCPCHGSVYNALTGAVEQGPATQPLHKVAVKISNGRVVTA
ncbi:Rieske Fe-S protein [Amycolatopsis sulphurea]|uniref:Cytochrome bc1 complex Rieske iron-sulfur subunit n=1 Tax=Amycolatopsis sulphurea TaxID=76022 RepID=A0A2A9G1J7_9PSEU|nr:Rieske (2Fe-2S) protein [Amycolatopsis sulphurea]PFG56615.1 Rieske Fe-S protein [Amycolatopsis sulphurea]